MHISRMANAVGRTKIRMMYELAQTLDDVISFTVGEPDFPTPQNIVDACKRSLDAHQTGYAPNQGVVELREAVAEHLRKTRGVAYTPDEVIITAGGINALRAATEALLDPGDEVLVSDPCWPNHFNHPALIGAVPVRVPVEADTCFLSAGRLAEYVTPRTRMLILNSPANPTGAVADRATIGQICAFAREHDLAVVSDEVYEDILFDGAAFVSPLMFEGMRERTVVVGALSKSYAMTGWRLGYAAGPRDVIAAMLRVNENTIASPTTFVQYAGIEALKGDQSAVRAMTAEFQHRRDLIWRELNAMPGISCRKPQGAFYAWPDIRETGLQSEEFAVRLLKEARVCVTPGDGFGPSGEGFLRLSYALSTEDLMEGMRRMRAFCESL